MKNWKDVFVKELAQTAQSGKACEAAGVTRATAFAARRDDSSFAAAWSAALEQAMDRLEQVLLRTPHTQLDYQNIRRRLSV